MKRYALLLPLLAVAGCAPVKVIKAPKNELATLKGEKLTVVTYTKPDFVAFTAGKATFGLIGALAMKSAGNKIVADNHVSDPASGIANSLSTYYRPLLAPSDVTALARMSSDKPLDLSQAAGGHGLILDVRTLGWEFNYFPTNWTHYHVTYAVRARLINAATHEVISQVPCSFATDKDAATAPTHDQLLANDAQVLKSKLNQAAQACTSKIEENMFAG